MGGFASFIGGMGEDLAQRNRDLLAQRFVQTQNAQQMMQNRAQAVAQQIQQLRRDNPDDAEVNDLWTEAEIGALTGKLDDRALEQFGKRLIDVRRSLQQRRMQERAVQADRARNTEAVNSSLDQYRSGGIQPQVQAPVVPPVQPVMPSNPLAGMIGGGGLAQSPTSPVQPQAQGGGSSPTAAFRSAGARPTSPPPLVPPAGGEIDLAGIQPAGPQPGGSSGTEQFTQAAPFGSDAPILAPVDAEADLPSMALSGGTATTSGGPNYNDQIVARDFEKFMVTGHMTPLLKQRLGLLETGDAAINLAGRQGELARTQGRQRVEDVSGYFQPLNLTPEHTAYIQAEAYNPSMQFPPPPTQHELSPGEALIGPDGKLLYLNPGTSAPGTSAFSVARTKLEEELGRPLTSNETVELQRRLAGGEPLYPVVRGGSITYVPRSQAAGQAAPRTLYNIEGSPTTGGIPGVSLTPPPPPPVGVQEDLAAMKDNLAEFAILETRLADPRYTGRLGPAAGRLTLAQISLGGGVGLSPEELELAVQLQNLLTSRAFERGGQQLTGTELERFRYNTPGQSDTLLTAIVKSREATRTLRQTFNNRVSTVPLRQRGQMNLDLPVAPPGDETDVVEYIRDSSGRLVRK